MARRRSSPEPERDWTGVPRDDIVEKARTTALNILGFSDRASGYVTTRLRDKGYPDDVVVEVVERLVEVGLINDVGYASTLARAQHRERGLSRRAVAAELRRKDLPPEVVEVAVEEITVEDETVRARELVRSRSRSMSRLEPSVRERRLVGMLVRKGYGIGFAFTVVREVMSEGESSS
jgi:regulatory protein